MGWSWISFFIQISVWIYLIYGMHNTLKARLALAKDVREATKIFRYKQTKFDECLKRTAEVLKRLAVEEGVARDDIRLEILGIIDNLPRAGYSQEEDTSLH